MDREVPSIVVGRREGGEPADALQHFYVCKACGQPVDMRDLGAVFHHEEPGHERLSEAEAFRLLDVRDLSRARLLERAAGPAN